MLLDVLVMLAACPVEKNNVVCTPHWSGQTYLKKYWNSFLTDINDAQRMSLMSLMILTFHLALGL